MTLEIKNTIVRSFAQCDFSELTIPIIVVYFHPDDDPEMCVARVFDVDRPTDVIMRAESIWTLEYDIRRTTPFCKDGAAAGGRSSHRQYMDVKTASVTINKLSTHTYIMCITKIITAAVGRAAGEV